MYPSMHVYVAVDPKIGNVASLEYVIVKNGPLGRYWHAGL